MFLLRQFGGLAFLVTTAIVLALLHKEQINVYVDRVMQPLPDATQEAARKFTRGQSLLRSLCFFWDRIPTDLELSHRYFTMNVSSIQCDGFVFLNLLGVVKR